MYSKPWSIDANLAHTSYEAGILVRWSLVTNIWNSPLTNLQEDPNQTPPDDMWRMTDSPLNAPNTPEDFAISFEKGLPVKLTLASGETLTDSLDIFTTLNAIGRKHGIGRIDIVENRYIGIKSRGCYDSPAMTILRAAHIDLEGLVLDREVRSLRDQFVTFNWSKLVYNGLYFSPEREFIEKSVIASQETVNGTVRLRAYKGSVSILGRFSETEKLYSAEESSMDSLVDFSPVDTTGFIGISKIRLAKYGQRKADMGESLSRA